METAMQTALTGRSTPPLVLEVREPMTEEDRNAEKLLKDFLPKIGRAADDFALRVYTNGRAETYALPALDVCGYRYAGLDQIEKEFILKEQADYDRWVRLFPTREQVPLFGNPLR